MNKQLKISLVAVTMVCIFSFIFFCLWIYQSKEDAKKFNMEVAVFTYDYDEEKNVVEAESPIDYQE